MDMSRFDDGQRARRHVVLAAIAALHIGALLWWKGPHMPVRANSGTIFSELVFIAAPGIDVAPAPRPVPEAARPAARRSPKITAVPRTTVLQPNILPPSAPTPGSLPAPQAITLPPPAEPAPEPAPAVSADDILRKAKLSVGAIDRDLRRQSLNPADRIIARDETTLAARIGAAAKQHGTTVTESVAADGTRITRVSGATTYCARMESNALTGGRDPFKDGVKTRVSSCPQ
jgi:hypothetical protein